jgi:hypothetical protein
MRVISGSLLASASQPARRPDIEINHSFRGRLDPIFNICGLRLHALAHGLLEEI